MGAWIMLRLVRLVGLLSLTRRALRRWHTEDIVQAGLLFVLFQEFCQQRQEVASTSDQHPAWNLRFEMCAAL